MHDPYEEEPSTSMAEDIQGPPEPIITLLLTTIHVSPFEGLVDIPLELVGAPSPFFMSVFTQQIISTLVSSL